VRKCRGLFRVLKRATPFLSRELLRLAYLALIRTHLEYACAIAAPSHLRKFETIQKYASRVICGASPRAHSEPLLTSLRLQSLTLRLEAHVLKLVKSIIAGHSHPAFDHFFKTEVSGSLIIVHKPQIKVGSKFF